MTVFIYLTIFISHFALFVTVIIFLTYLIDLMHFKYNKKTQPLPTILDCGDKRSGGACSNCDIVKLMDEEGKIIQI